MRKSSNLYLLLMRFSAFGGTILCYLILMEIVTVLWLVPYIAIVSTGYYWVHSTLIRPLNTLSELTENDPTGRRLGAQPLANAADEVVKIHSNFNRLYQHIGRTLDKTEMSQAAELQAMNRLNALIENVSLSIVTIDTKGHILHFNPATPIMFNKTSKQLMGCQISRLLPRLNIHGGLFKQILNAGVDIELDAVTGSTTKPVELSCVELQVSDTESQYILILHDISQRKNYEDRLRNLNQRLINTSRQAGIAEIATSILHNVGNVLNSVNTSVAMLRHGLEKSQVDGLKHSVEMLKSEGPHLFEQEGKGPQLLEYLEALTGQLDDAKQNNLTEVATLKQNVNHIAEIVSAQQKFAGKTGIVEHLNIAKLIEEALSINAVSLENNKVEIERDFEPVIEVESERAKIVQILVNLIRNANEAMIPTKQSAAKLKIKVRFEGRKLKINVTDNGIGINKENLEKMFRYGFTTKPDGHGFGLHSCALAAREMGGKLKVYSDGEGKGARFELTLPTKEKT